MKNNKEVLVVGIQHHCNGAMVVVNTTRSRNTQSIIFPSWFKILKRNPIHMDCALLLVLFSSDRIIGGVIYRTAGCKVQGWIKFDNHYGASKKISPSKPRKILQVDDPVLGAKDFSLFKTNNIYIYIGYELWNLSCLPPVLYFPAASPDPIANYHRNV